MSEWILLETLGRDEPRVIGVGRKPRAMKRVSDVVRGRNRNILDTAVTKVQKSQQDYAADVGDQRVIAEPFLSPLDRINAIQVWIGPVGSEPPERLPTGAWVWDLDKGTCLASAQVHEVYRMPPEKSLTEISRVQSMYGVTTSARRQSEALALAMAGPDGLELHEQWQVRRYDDILRDLNFACRMTIDNGGHKWLHGITQDITSGESAIAPPLTFAETLVEAEMAAQVGAYAALVDIDRLVAIRWLSTPMPEVQCEMTGDPALDPAIHPDDLAAARQIAQDVRIAPTEGTIRVRRIGGGWIAISMVATLVELDRNSFAALVKMKIKK